MHVRLAIANDAEVAVHVLRESITQLCISNHQNDPPTLARWLRNKNVEQFNQWCADPDIFLVVAEQNSSIVGVGLMRRSGDFDLCYLKPGWQRKRIGSAIVSAIEDQARNWGILEMRLLSARDAQSFWERTTDTFQMGNRRRPTELLWTFPIAKILDVTTGIESLAFDPTVSTKNSLIHNRRSAYCTIPVRESL